MVDGLLPSPDFDHRPDVCAGWGAMYIRLFGLHAEVMVVLLAHWGHQQLRRRPQLKQYARYLVSAHRCPSIEKGGLIKGSPKV